MIKDNFKSLNSKIFLVTFNTFYKKNISGLGFKNFLLLILKHKFYKKKVLKVIK